MSIEWKEGSVCFAGGFQFKVWDVSRGELITVDNVSIFDFEAVLSFKDFQLSTIKQGDYISKSELDTEDKYNRAVEEFGLFGFYRVGSYSSFILDVHTVMFVNENLSFVAHVESTKTKRKITFDQLMAIGELKRLMNERDKLTPDEETELKSRSMASELDRQDEEWPKIGDEVCWSNGCYKGVVKARHWNDLWVMELDGDFSTLYVDDVSKPKSKEDLLIEELQTKLIENKAVDTWMLASNIVNGDIEGLSYKSSEVVK